MKKVLALSVGLLLAHDCHTQSQLKVSNEALSKAEEETDKLRFEIANVRGANASLKKQREQTGKALSKALMQARDFKADIEACEVALSASDALLDEYTREIQILEARLQASLFVEESKCPEQQLDPMQEWWITGIFMGPLCGQSWFFDLNQ
jgi:hypothetical protein